MQFLKFIYYCQNFQNIIIIQLQMILKIYQQNNHLKFHLKNLGYNFHN